MDLAKFCKSSQAKAKTDILQTAYGSYGTAAALFKNFSAKSAMKQRLEIWNHLHVGVVVGHESYAK